MIPIVTEIARWMGNRTSERWRERGEGGRREEVGRVEGGREDGGESNAVMLTPQSH